MSYTPQDYFFKKAKAQNYAARSVFKLQEIDERFALFQKGDSVLDLGAAPGSWSQYAAQRIGPDGCILGIDLQPIAITIPNAVFIAGDLNAIDIATIAAQQKISLPFDVVLSDMAPKTTGIHITDQARSKELCDLAFSVAERFLRRGGNFVCKMFASDDLGHFRKQLLPRFHRIETARPRSTRKESAEVFFVGLGFRPRPQ